MMDAPLGIRIDTAKLPRGWKKTATECCQRIARDTPDNQPVTEQNAEFLGLLLTLHPCAEEKIGPGVAYFTAGPIGSYRTRGFTVHRTDGSSTDFSWRECIKGSSHTDLVRGAMRQAAAAQVLAFKQQMANSGSLQCAVTGAPLTWSGCHVDHAPPEFITLADGYARQAGGYDLVELTPSQDGQTGRALTVPHETAWAQYHQDRAHLQLVSIAAHKELTHGRAS
jgi:hypothetical protein